MNIRCLLFTLLPPPGALARGLVFLAALLPLLAGCHRETPKAASSPAIVARVDGFSITADELAEALARRARAHGSRFDFEADRQKVLDELIRERVLLARAQAAGYDRQPRLVRRWEQMLVAQYEADLRTNDAPRTAPTAAEVEQHYRAHAAEFTTPEAVRVAWIQLKGSPKAQPEKRAALHAKASSLLDAARVLPPSEPAFGELARTHSDDHATRHLGGDCGWVERGSAVGAWPAEIAEAVFALENPGDLSPVIESGGSCYLLKLIGRRPASARPLAEVRERIVHRLDELARQRIEADRFAREKAATRVSIDPAALAAVPRPVSAPALANVPTAPPPLPAR